MRIGYTLAGVSPIIMHNRAAGLDTRSPVSREITTIAAQKGGNRTDVDDLRLQELECQRSLYLDADCKPTLSAAALRAMIEAGARKVRQGPQVRGGLMIEPEVSFRYNVERYGETLETLVKTTQFTVPVVVASQSILRRVLSDEERAGRSRSAIGGGTGVRPRSLGRRPGVAATLSSGRGEERQPAGSSIRRRRCRREQRDREPPGARAAEQPPDGARAQGRARARRSGAYSLLKDLPGGRGHRPRPWSFVGPRSGRSWTGRSRSRSRSRARCSCWSLKRRSSSSFRMSC